MGKVKSVKGEICINNGILLVGRCKEYTGGDTYLHRPIYSHAGRPVHLSKVISGLGFVELL